MMMLLFITVLLACVSGHSYLSEPKTRSNQRESQTGCKAPACTTCDGGFVTAGKFLQQAKRGETINLRWPRNNHPYGFIRLAWAPMEKSGDPKAFEEMIQEWTCHEMTCSSGQSDPEAGDADGPIGKCTHSIQIPAQIPDGNYTLQWVWVGGAFALGDYFSCVDYEISGGIPLSKEPLTITGKFGDFHSKPQNVCKYRNANDVGPCAIEPCTTGNRMGTHSGVPMYFEKNQAALLGSAALLGNSTGQNQTIGNSSTTESVVLPQPVATNVPTLEVKPQEAAQNKTEFPETILSKDEDLFVAKYILTFKDPITHVFGAILRVTNGPKIINSWTINFVFQNNMTVTKVFGADLSENENGGTVISSNRPVEADGVLVIGIEGIF